MRQRIIFFILALPVFYACERELDFREFDLKPRLCVMGVAGDSDTTVVHLRPAKAMGDSLSEPFSVAGARVSMLVNGEEVPLSVADESVPEIPLGSWFSTRPMSPGERVEFSASVDGVDPVSAECVVPEDFPEYELKLEARTVYSGYNGNTEVEPHLYVTVNFEDDPDTDDCYGMQVYRLEETYGYANPEKRYRYMEPYVYSSDFFELPPSQQPMMVHYTPDTGLFSDEYAPMLIVDDRGFTDGKGKIEFATKYNEDSERVDSYDGTKYGYRYMYKVCLYRLSPELQRFIKSGEIVAGTIPILLMLAPPSYIYTNIRGGVGIFGGMTCTETGWLPNAEL